VTPLLVAGSLATAAGTVAGDSSAPESSPELASLRRRMWLRRNWNGSAPAERRAPIE
jgi:hypothetical protein